jgi:glycosyltransferase involved in cell wall biosynthesis
MSEIKVTVLMPAFNAGKYIAEAIGSVLSQTYPHFELLIINDGSTDNTVQEIGQFADSRIRLINVDHQGIVAVLNKGLREAKGYYIARFDADDICFPDRLRIQYEFMNTNADYIMTGTEAAYVDMNGEYVFTLKYDAYADDAIRNLDATICPFSHVTVMYKKDEVLNAGGYDINAHTFEDHLLWLKLIPLGKVCNLAQPLVKVRFNPESITIDEKWRGREFIDLKYSCIRKGTVTAEEGDRLQKIISKQNFNKLKKGAYYSLIAKKYLWDNYDPGRARKFLRRLMNYYPVRPGAYFLYLVSFLPRKTISFLYRKRPRRN